MKKLKQIWRYYFNTEIRKLKKLKIALKEEHRQGFLRGICGTIYTCNFKTSVDYFNHTERNILYTLLQQYSPIGENNTNNFFFPKGELQPRLDWCDMVINKIMVQ